MTDQPKGTPPMPSIERPNLQAIRDASQDLRYDLQLRFRSDIARLCDWADAQDARIAELESALNASRALICESSMQCGHPLENGECGFADDCIFHALINGIDAALAPEQGGTDER